MAKAVRHLMAILCSNTFLERNRTERGIQLAAIDCILHRGPLNCWWFCPTCHGTVSHCMIYMSISIFFCFIIVYFTKNMLHT